MCIYVYENDEDVYLCPSGTAKTEQKIKVDLTDSQALYGKI